MTRMIYHMCREEAWTEAMAGARYDGTEAAQTAALGPDGSHLFPPLV